MKILTAQQMRRIDERAMQEHRISSAELMDRAGSAAAERLLHILPAIRELPPLILCGKGNNGGDGLALARHLLVEEGIASRVVLIASSGSLAPTATLHLKRAQEAGVKVEEAPGPKEWEEMAEALADHEVIVDALLGTGLSGPARDLTARVIVDLNDSTAIVVSLDIPSGLSGDSAAIVGPAVHADHTIALVCPKLPHVFPPASLLAGRLHVVDIGIPEAAIAAEDVALNMITREDVWPLLEPRHPEAHKGDFGKLLVIAGSVGRSGAAALVAHAALRAGAGLVTAATAASAQPILAGHLMELMTEGLPETHGSIAMAALPLLRDLMQGADVLALGPGLTTREETSRLVRAVVSETTLPVVLDADGINAFAGRAAELTRGERLLILTPHPGEMARLLSTESSPVTIEQVQADRVKTARDFTQAHGCYLVLKGYRTVVASPEGEIWINLTGNAGMATAGSGDVLTGIIAGLLGQGLAPMDACRVGVFLHGLAGDLAAGDLGETPLMAGDLIAYLSQAFEEVLAENTDDEEP